MRIDRNKQGDVMLSQQAYYECMLKHFNMYLCSPITTPFPSGLILSVKDCPSTPDKIDEMKCIPFCEALGLLMWL